jgi:transposase-like protein
MNLSEITKLTEEESRAYLESIRWPTTPVCPHCGSKEAVKLQGKATRPGVYKCKAPACRKQFTVTVGTVMERSHISLRHWAMSFHLLCSSKKGMSAHQLHRSLGVTYKTAWFLFHRIRYAMDQGAFAGKLKGTVEVDETYIGGKSKYGNRGRGSESKAPVVALVERGGRARAKPVEWVTSHELGKVISENVEKVAHLMTDEFAPYKKIGKEYASHGRIKHKSGIYSLNGVSTNQAESFFALLKRGIHGVFHKVSLKHLHRYCDEFSFRWSHRKMTDSERRDAAVKATEGKRLAYR